MSLSAILIALAILFIIATVPVWPYSRTWGVWPSGALDLVLVVLVGVLVMGYGDRPAGHEGSEWRPG
jgi:hypothetical protein